jgi:subtilisin family serine protease
VPIILEMRSLPPVVPLVFCLLGLAWCAPVALAGGSGEVIVRYADGVGAGTRADVRARVDGDVTQVIGSGGATQALDVHGSPAAAVATLEDDPHVLWAEPNEVVHAQWIPNDPSFGDQWAYRNIGQFSGGVPGADIDLNAAWDGERGSSSVVVGVVDTGVYAGHQDFANLHVLAGHDFVNNDADPADDNGHGTGTTGVIAAGADDGIGVAGIASPSSVVEAKVLNAQGAGTYASVASGLDYAAAQGARIVNVSIGGGFSQAMLDAINAHPNTLYVIAAGNSAVDNDGAAAERFPCALPAANIVCVAATDVNDTLASFSNWGASSVDLGAPGVWIYGPTIGSASAMDYWSGTSFSAPMVAGVAALLAAHDPTISVAQLKSVLMTSGDADPALAGKTVSGRRLNALGALNALASLPAGAPAATSPPSISGTAKTGSALTGSDGTWANAADATFAVEWERCDVTGAACASIGGSAGQHTYTLTEADAGATVRFAVTATNGSGSVTAESPPTGRVVSTAPPVLQGALGLAGTAAYGSVLSVPSTGTWIPQPDRYAYAWFRCAADGTACAQIAGASASTYSLDVSDVGKRLFSRVAASTGAASPRPTGTADTALTGVVTGAPARLEAAPSLSAASSVEGAVLRIGTVTVSGVPAPAVTAQWQQCDAVGAACIDLAGRTSGTLTLTSAMVGSRIRALVRATNTIGSDAAPTAATDVVAAAPGVAPTPDAGIVAPVLAAPIPTATVPASNATRPTVSLTGKLARRTSAGRRLSVRLGCTGRAGTSCSAVVSVTLASGAPVAGATSRRILGRGTVRIRAGRSTTANVSLTATGRRNIRRGTRIRVTVTPAGRRAVTAVLTVR